jgi:hypothetical protein
VHISGTYNSSGTGYINGNVSITAVGPTMAFKIPRMVLSVSREAGIRQYLVPGRRTSFMQ